MKKPQLCVALSLSLSLVESTVISAGAAPDATSIWQKMSAIPSTGSTSKRSTQNRYRSSAATKSDTAQKASRSISGRATGSGAQGHSMLFMPAKSKPSIAALEAPAAALTIHSSLSGDTSESADAAFNKPLMVASGESLPYTPAAVPGAAPSVALKAGEARNLLAQLAPDRLISQGDTGVSVTPIPPVVSGTVDLEEFKTSNVIDLKVAQSRTFKLKNKIVRTSISDPGIAEPVVVAENQIVLLGKSSGIATMVLWDDAGNSVAVDLRVSRDFSTLQAALREIDPRIIVKAFSVNGQDRVLLLGDVDHPESVIRAFGTANVFMDDRGFNVQIANNRIVGARVGEQGASGGGSGGGQSGQLATLSSVDKYTFFSNINNNVSKAQVLTSDGGRVTSLVKVRKVPLIVLHVTFMEVNSIALRELGVQLGLNFTTNHFTFAMGGNNSISPAVLAAAPPFNETNGPAGGPFTVAAPGFVSATTVAVNSANSTLTPTLGLGQPLLNEAAGALLPTSVLLGAPGGATFGTAGLQNLFTSLVSVQDGQSGVWGIQPTIQGIITQTRARILAEPTLVTISGERASFLAGGEIPIISTGATAGATAQSVTFEPFGLRINVIPVLMENGNLNLQIAPEERLVSNVLSFQPSSLSSSIPGFTTRKAQTIVEMRPGQELFIAGLLSTNNGRDIIKTPVLGEIPVIGALYRSKAFSKNESELVVAVRPEIILPGTPGQLKLPEEIGRVEGPRDMNMFQVEPTVIDERHYTSGRSERYQKTSPTLPEGSPIPDNE
jgi:Flp pilus assembly secretin CpaC